MTANASTIQKLLSVPICRGLTEREAEAIVDIAQEINIKNGETLFREGDPGDAVYAVLEGQLEVVKGNGSAAQVLAKVGQGAVLGEMSLLGGGAQRSASAVASSEARLLKISAAGFNKLISSDNVAALKVVSALAQVMSHRLQQANEKLMELATRSQRKEELVDFQKILSHWSF